MPITGASVSSWAEELSQLAARFTDSFEDRFGYPPGENHVVVAEPRRTQDELASLGLQGAHADLVTLYAQIESVSLPDIGNGLFIHPVADPAKSGQPTTLTGDTEDQITVFGSDGGGNLFALNATGDKVYRLSSGALHGDTYEADAGEFTVIAPLLGGFLELVLTATARALS